MATKKQREAAKTAVSQSATSTFTGKTIGIWDLEYYYAEQHIDCFNPDAMKISGYHKQKGDRVHLLVNERDLNRQYDLIYIIREHDDTPQAPATWLMKDNIVWMGDANAEVFGQALLSDVMLRCRPDYLLYPEQNTIYERAEFGYLIDYKGQLIDESQSWSNTLKRKVNFNADRYLWEASDEVILAVLEQMKHWTRPSFYYPIDFQRLYNNKKLMEAFESLPLKMGCVLKWQRMEYFDTGEFLRFMCHLKEKFPAIYTGATEVSYDSMTVGNSQECTDLIQDLVETVDFIKSHGIDANIADSDKYFNGIFQEILQEVRRWLSYYYSLSWIEYLATTDMGLRWVSFPELKTYWCNPRKWSSRFRRLLCATYKNEDLILHRYNDVYLSDNDIPWDLWADEFKLGI